MALVMAVAMTEPGLTLAEELGAVISAEDCEARFSGKTLAYAMSGWVWGTETHLTERRVIYRPDGKDCIFGHWYPEGQSICFDYEDREQPVCWMFADGPSGVTANFMSPPDSAPTMTVKQTEPFACPKFGS